MWIDVEPVLGCPRYFGKELQDAVKTSIQISWPGPSRMTIRVPSGGLEWDIELGTTATVRLLTAVASRIPDRVWRQRPVLSTVAAIAGPMLRAGRITLHGTTPNGQWFKVYPRSIWRVTASRATLSGEDLGLTRPLEQPTMLADFRIPRRGFLVAGDGHFQPTTTSVTVSRLVRAATQLTVPPN